MRNHDRLRVLVAWGVLSAGAWWAGAHGGEPSVTLPAVSPAVTIEASPTDEQRVSLEVARDRARLMHEIYVATLDVMHHRYFHGERAIIPARAMEDVFTHMKEHSASEARWIGVNLKPMSVSHEPKTAFEKRAAEELATGKATFDAVENGYYRHAGAILLTDGCVNCHGGFFKEQTKSPKYAGLVISIPVKESSPK